MLDKYWIFILGFLISIIIAPLIIKFITKLKCGQNILSYVDKHMSKQGTPTMGGIIFLMSLLICFFVTFGKSSRLASIVLLVTFSYGLLGFLDDFLKIKLKHNEGLKPYQKFIGQFGIAIIIAIFVYRSGMVSNSIILPFALKQLDIGWWIIPFVIIFFVAVTNSVNLTDGLDGLAGGVSFVNVLTVALVLGVISASGMLAAPAEEYASIVKLCFALCGALLGYLVYNWSPASVFMGDTGSLALGGFLASVLTFSNLYLLMFTVGIMFVLNTLSVVLQVGYYKLTHKRIFKMAPLHHHFEQSGVKETKIVFCYIAISTIMLFVTIIIF